MIKTNNNNSNLKAARKNKNDEFYTQLIDIEKELKHYTEHFKDKVVYLNCDNYQSSNFYQYFVLNFEKLELKKLITSHFNQEGKSESTETLLIDNKLILKVNQLKGDGDFRSEECIELLKEADIVVTNPPFSLFREYVAQLVEFEKQFVIVGNLNAITYKDIFKLIKINSLWLGYNNGDMSFKVPDYYESRETRFWIDNNGQKWRSLGVRWFTNINHKKRNEELILYKKYNEVEYLKYDNYDAIEVSKVKDIPINYDGVMGVPISFMDKFNSNQFEILDINPHFFIIVDSGLPKPKQLKLTGKKDPYARIIIKHKK